MANKITKKNVLMALQTLNITEGIKVGDDVTVTPEDIAEFLQSQIDQIDKKADKAREKQAEAKVAGDELRGRIEAILDENLKTIADIVDILDEADVTPAKVVSRMGQLVKLGKVTKESTKTEDGRRVMAYKLATASEVDDVPFDED